MILLILYDIIIQIFFVKVFKVMISSILTNFYNIFTILFFVLLFIFFLFSIYFICSNVRMMLIEI